MNAVAQFLKKDETCLDGPLNILGDGLIVKLGGESGAMTAMLGITPPKAGPPLHRHSREDESFFVLEGDYLFETDGKQNRAGPGDFVFLPRGTAHTFQNVGETEGRMLITAQPAGVERFFRRDGPCDTWDEGSGDGCGVADLCEVWDRISGMSDGSKNEGLSDVVRKQTWAKRRPESLRPSSGYQNHWHGWRR
jgi:quercetin dioxygenase-like cupin family protein